MFVVHPGPASSPLPVPLLPEDLTSLLTAAEKRYLSTRIKVDVAAKEVWISSYYLDTNPYIHSTTISSSAVSLVYTGETFERENFREFCGFGAISES